MKRIFSIVILMSLLGAGSAQAFEVGGLLGYRGNKLDFSQSGWSSSSTGAYSVGALLWFGFDILKVRTGLVSTDRSTTFSVQTGGTTVDGKVTMNYFDIPLNIEIGIPATSFYVFGGLYYGLLSNQKCEATNPAGSACTLKVQSSNYGLDLGVGFDLIDLTLFKLSAEGFYEKSLGSVADGGTVSVTTEGYGANLVGRAGF